MFLDLDGFKPVNDSLGHFTGDVILKEVSVRLKEHFSSNQMISRLGGDEFVIILEDIADVKGTCKELLQLLAESFCS
ncbi:GGDEF domain-containing protein [Anaerobacillus sp. HL2]|nr:GGDEF domain-containing protein [Anaerobacillus sp. HL2]